MRDLVGATFEFRMEVGGRDHEYVLVLCLRPRKWQPLLAFYLLSAKTICGLERSHLMVATSALFPHERSVVRFEFLEME